MSQENVDLAWRATEALAAGDWETLSEVCHPEIEWEETPGLGPDASVYRGIEEIRGAVESWFGMWDDYSSEVRDCLDTGDQVVFLVQERGRGRSTGAAVERELGQIAAVRDGKIVRVRLYGSWAEALEAAGLGKGAMPQDNVAVVRTIYDAWRREDYPGPTGLFDPGIEYVNPDGAVEPGTRSGIEEFRQALEKVLEAWEFWRIEPEELRGLGNHVVAVIRYEARGRNSSVELEGRESALWTLRDGRVLRYQWFHGPAEALQAVGLSE